ncbi:MAG: HTH-type transcriptional regulator BetI [Pseudomonadota bacterium]
MNTPITHRTLHQIKSEHTRERLLETALVLMQDKGQGQFSLHELARAAGLTAGAVQHHFASKADLMLEVITRLIQQLEAQSDFWPSERWSLKRRSEHFVTQAWACLYGQPRFVVAWSAYLAAREDPRMVAHIVDRRSLLSGHLQYHMARCFPEMCQGPLATARVQFVLSALRGMGLVAPFSPEAHVPPQLQVLSDYLQSFQPQET